MTKTAHPRSKKHKIDYDYDFYSDSDSDSDSEEGFVYMTQILIVDIFPIKELDTKQWRSFDRAACNVVDFLQCAPLFKDSSGFHFTPLLAMCVQWGAMNNYDLIDTETETTVNNWKQLLNLFALCEFI